MARKRGGAAGLWDRNKGWLKSVVPMALGAIPGVGVPLAVGAGAAMRGLDRPGKRGIGLDVGEGIRGAAEGYGMGKLGQGARVGIGKMLAPKAVTKITPGLSNAEVARQLNPMLSGAPRAATGTAGGNSLAQIVAPSAAASATPSAAPAQAGGGNALTKTLDFATKYEKPLGMLVEGVAGGVPSAEVETARARNTLDERRFEEEMRRQRMLEQRQALLAELLMPILNSRLGERGFGQEGYQGVASMQGAVPGFGTYTPPPRSAPRAMSSVSPLQSSVSQLQSSVAPLRSTVSPLRR